MFDGIKNFIQSKFEPKEEDFYKSGLLTPVLFEKAGDQLEPLGWQWKKAVSSNKNHEKLPNPEKQFLVTSGRSERRIKDVMKQEMKMELVDGFYTPVQEGNEEEEEKEVEERTYTISITYDSYYHVPRLWLSGFDSNGTPLTGKQIFQDITSEHENETVTYEDHPHLNEKQVTIHPCKHAERLKQFVAEAKERNKTINPEQALLVFLQFMPSIMPTIEIDSNTDISLGQ